MANREPVDTPDLGFRVWSNALKAAMPRAHRHSDIELNYIDSGELEYLFNGELRSVQPRRLTLFWAAIPHQVTLARGVRLASWITIPLEWFLQWRLPHATTQAVLRGAVLAEREESALTPMLLARWSADLLHAQADQRDITALEVEACIRRLAVCGLAGARNNPRKTPPRQQRTTAAQPALTDKTIRHIVAMTRFMADRHRQFITTADIARDAGLHPNYAMTLFKWFTGMSLGAYLTRLRLSHAQRLLATTKKSAAQVAMESGFGSVSRFYEAFATHTGDSPIRYRRAMKR